MAAVHWEARGLTLGLPRLLPLLLHESMPKKLQKISLHPQLLLRLLHGQLLQVVGDGVLRLPELHVHAIDPMGSLVYPIICNQLN